MTLHNIHVIGIAETWLTDNVENSEISLDGFILYRKDRKAVKLGKGGGVLLYVHTSLTSIECTDLNMCKNESVWCKISTGANSSDDLYVGAVYRSPNADVAEIDDLFSVIKCVSSKHVVIMGDLNYPGINWNNLECDDTGNQFLNIVQDAFLFQHVLVPTRGTNILDLVLTSEESMVEELQVLQHLANSDHNIILFKLVCSTVIKSNCIVKNDYNKGDYCKMNEFLSSLDWDLLFRDRRVEDMWTAFHEAILLGVDKFIPKKKNKSRRKYPLWMTRNAIRACKSKGILWKRYRESKSYNDYVEYKRIANKCSNEYKTAKRNFEIKLAKDIKKNPKSFYSYVRSKSKTKDKVGPLKDKNGELVSDDLGMCTILNDQFRSVFTVEKDRDNGNSLPRVKDELTSDQVNDLTDINITEELVLKYLRKLKINKAPGTDNLVPRVLVETATAIAKPLCMIFCMSLCDGVVPREWKCANVCAIFKKGAKSDASNYRPVSLTSQICKVFEAILRDAITSHFQMYNLIKESQHGFMRKKSCLTNLLEFLEYVTEYVDNGEPVDVIYLDFQKAFDKVPHQRLMLKLVSLGVNGRVASWIKDWLADRKQRVVLNGCMSDWCEVASGVPQGSVLGPLLFVVFINDIDQCVTSKLLKFADDTKLMKPVSSTHEINMLRNDLCNLYSWSEDWLMLFNLDKCKVMHLGKNNVKSQYVMGGQILQEVSEEKDLGVIISNDLKVSSQCSKAAKTANRILGMISRTFIYKNKDTMLLLYKSLVRPHLEYCIQTWRPHLQKDIDLLERVQHRATKMIATFGSLTYEDRLLRLKLTTLETRRLRGDLIEVFKILKGFEDVDYSKFFTLSTSHLRGHSLKIFKTRFNTNCGKYLFSNRIVVEWNLLSEDIVSCNTLDSFKGKLDLYLRTCRGFT